MALLSLPGAWESGIQPPLLLIVRERIRPGDEAAYDRTEIEIRRVCARWGCPNAYIGLVSTAQPSEAWWITAWSSQDELDLAGALYAGNPALTDRLTPLNARKRELTEEPTTALAKAAGTAPFSLAGARFVTVTPVNRHARTGAFYEFPDGERITVAGRAELARPAPGGVVLAMQPKWSLPPPALVRADPAFWGGDPS